LKEQQLKILAVDDHTLFRKGTVMLLETFEEVAEVHEANNGREALDLMKTQPVDILLLDLEMPVLDGWQTAEKVLRRFPGVYIIMISMHNSLEMISDLIEIGVHSYLLKNCTPEEMRKAINTVYNNDFYYNQLVAEALRQKVVEKSNQAARDLTNNGLTAREVEVLKLICEELTMREIGERLYLSEQTIMTHRKNLMRKTEVKNAVGLVKYAIQNGLISL
jgi:DNA-binding NarL/FixJ family response regulator